MSIAPRFPAPGLIRSRFRLMWIGYATLVAVSLTYYATVLAWGNGLGVDFACFRAAALVLGHGGNPYDFSQLWRVENALYNLPAHLQPGSPAYYYLDRYYNPPLFATALRPLAALTLAQGFAIYTGLVLACAVAGSWLTLAALGWTRHRLLVAALVVLSPCVFLTVRNGQQSTLLLFALGAALYALRRGWSGAAGALLAIGWVKPHLLIPIALAVPMLPAPRLALRCYAGFAIATAAGVAATVLTSGPGSLLDWLHTLVAYAGYAGAVQAYLPSLGGMSLIVLAHPWNMIAAAASMILAVGLAAAVIARARRRQDEPWAPLGAIVAIWLLLTPFAHANDDVLLLLPIAVAWGRDGARSMRLLPLLALWAISALPMAFLLPRPWSLLGVVPAGMALIAVLEAQRSSSADSDTEVGRRARVKPGRAA